MGTAEFKWGGVGWWAGGWCNLAMDKHSIQGGIENKTPTPSHVILSKLT